MSNYNSSINRRIVGYRFHPSDEELFGVYLKQKLLGRDSLSNVISLPKVNNLYGIEPWDIPKINWPLEFDPKKEKCKSTGEEIGFKRIMTFCKNDPLKTKKGKQDVLDHARVLSHR